MTRQKCPKCGDWPVCPTDDRGWCHKCQREDADRIWAEFGDATTFVCSTRHDQEDRL